MNSTEKNRLQSILTKLQNPNLSLKGTQKLYQGANINWNTTIDKEVKNEELEINALKYKIIESLINERFSFDVVGENDNERKQKLAKLSDEQLDFADLLCNEFTSLHRSILTNYDFLNDKNKENLKSLFGKGDGSFTPKDEIKELVQEIENFIPLLKNERNRRKSGQNQEEKNDFSSVDTQNLQRAINNLQNQLNNLQNQQPNQSNKDNSSELAKIAQTLNQLQNQIQELEKNKSNSPISQSEKQEITKLNEKLKQSQTDLKNKQKENSQSSPNQSQTQNDKGFNWLYVVIPGGVLLVIFIAITFYLLGKKSKKE